MASGEVGGLSVLPARGRAAQCRAGSGIGRKISYITTSEHGGSIDFLDGPNQWTDDSLLLGDLIFARDETVPTTRLIEVLDGFFSHVGVYVGDGRMVHSYSEGVVQWELTSDLYERYSCLALGRPKALSSEVRKAAAEFASSRVRAGADAVPYGAFDLGQTTGLRARARLLLWRKLLPQPSAAELDALMEWAHELIEQEQSRTEPTPTTCSGFAWRSWCHSGCPLRPKLVNGVLAKDLRQPQVLAVGSQHQIPAGFPPRERASRPRLLGRLVGVLQHDRLMGLSKDELDKAKHLANLWAESRPGLRRMLYPSNTVALHQTVTPGDLWCSDSMETRMFLSKECKDFATRWSKRSGRRL